LEQLAKHFDRLPREQSHSTLREPLRECLRRVRALDPRELGVLKGGWHLGETSRVVQAVLQAMPVLSNAMAAAYFAHSEISRTGGGLRP
jgi:hypothetical protein